MRQLNSGITEEKTEGRGNNNPLRLLEENDVRNLEKTEQKSRDLPYMVLKQERGADWVTQASSWDESGRNGQGIQAVKKKHRGDDSGEIEQMFRMILGRFFGGFWSHQPGILVRGLASLFGTGRRLFSAVFGSRHQMILVIRVRSTRSQKYSKAEGE